MIVHDGDRKCEINGRVAEMIRFLLDRSDKIARTPTIKIEHNCAGSKIQSRLVTFDSEAKIMDSIK